MKEMVGGCCVCSDERGWPENPLVYCDGQNCTVAVHQACYGIVTVPTGPWFCRKCESQERSARVRCELCPSRDGALKKTDNQGWAHVVCALYIPEVRFGNVTTMEPIILQLIPPERYAKTCYICQEIGKGNRATVGACMQCNKSGCKQQFHVTCAQALGLLCEEAGNYLDNVKYCGYCQHHYSKLKKGGNVKTIPPYKPVNHESASSDGTSSPEKELDPTAATPSSTPSVIPSKGVSNQASNLSSANSSSSSSSSSKQRKSNSTKQSGSSSSSTLNSTNANTSGSSNSNTTATSSSGSSSKTTSSSSNSSKDKDKHSKSLTKVSSSSKNQDKESSSSTSSTRDKFKSSKSSSKDTGSSGDHGSLSSSTILSASASSATSSLSTASSGTTSHGPKDPLGQKFTTLNFTESPVLNVEAEFSTNDKTLSSTPANNSSMASSSSTRDNKNSSSNSSGSSSAGKKRKADSSKSISSNSSSNVPDPIDINKDIIKDVSVTLIPLPIDKTQDIGGDSSEKISVSKKPKTDVSTSSAHHTAIHDTNPAQNLIGGQVASKQQQQAISQTGTSTNVSSSSSISTGLVSASSLPHIKPTILKEVSSGESRNRSDSPYTSSTSVGLNSSSDRTPSLYVSVPLSTANVPGINLPTTAASDHITQPNRNSPLVNHHTHQSAIIERQSPRILQNQRELQYSDHNAAISAIGSLHQSNMSPTLSQRSEPIDSGLKITYEKQNIRVAQLQEEQLPTRRSRSQSGDSSGKSSSRSGKKRSAGNSTSSSSSTTTTSAVPSTSAALPTGSNTDSNETSAITGPQQVGNLKGQQYKYNDPNNSSESLNPANIVKSSTTNSVTSEVPAPVISSSSSVSSKQMNKKLLRAQQQQQQQKQQQQATPPPSALQVPLQSSTLQPSSSSITSSNQISNDENPSHSIASSNSRTPDSVSLSNSASNITIGTSKDNNSSSGGLKFVYEQQIGGTPINQMISITPPAAADPIIKDSPPSSPGSEAGSARKRGRKSVESKDTLKMFFQNGGHATHMLGNQLNPASSVAQKMSDQLHMEIEAHSIYTQSGDSGPQLVGVPLPGKARNSMNSNASGSLSSVLGAANTNNGSGNTPQSLEQLLERQWEQGSQFLMEQAQHFDIASLLSCLHQLRTENVRLEEHVNNLIARRDHLLAVNARLAIPLNPVVPPNATVNNMHIINGPTSDSVSSRIARTNAHYTAQQQQMPMENGIDFRHSSSTNPSTISRHPPVNLNYSSSTSSIHNQHSSNSTSALSSTSSAPSVSSNNRHQQYQSHQQQLPQQQPLQQAPITAGSALSGQPPLLSSSSSALSTQQQQAVVEATQLLRINSASGGSGGGVRGINSTLNSSTNAAVVGAMIGSSGITSGSGGGGGVNLGSSSYHNATQQSAAYSTVHQSQLRRDDSHGKTS